ncbi:SOS response-associated peptidase family protein [Streptomyces morookaense]|uniref:SOS response-associated peptidase family protein n=1 Tax=Streptomyces morookaense TaxID=1970 RepID=UPI003570BFD3
MPGGGEHERAAAVLDGEPADAAGRIHPRMPLAIAPNDWGIWLDPGNQDPAEVRALLTAPRPGAWTPGRCPPPSTASATTVPS